MRRWALVILILSVTLSGCAGNNIFPSIGASMSNPLYVAVDSDLNRLYVLNSNYKVSYQDGSIHVVNIADLTSPARVNYTSVPSFTGQIYLDTTNLLLYSPNRFSSGNTDTTDGLFQINVNEAAGSFLSRTEYAAGDDPFGIVCCDAANDILVATEAGFIDYYAVDSSMAHAQQTMTAPLSTGTTLAGTGTTRLTIFGTQAVVTRSYGGAWVVNLSELGSSNAVDYYINGMTNPRGITSDATYIYINNVEYSGGQVGSLVILDISSLTPSTSNTTATVTDLADVQVSNLTLAGIEPQEILIDDDTVYVTDFDNDAVYIMTLSADRTWITGTTTVSVGDEPYGMALYSTGGSVAPATHLIVANSGNASGGNTVSIIDLTAATPAIVGTYP